MAGGQFTLLMKREQWSWREFGATYGETLEKYAANPYTVAELPLAERLKGRRRGRQFARRAARKPNERPCRE
ncbi:MAG: hypothetical protein ABI664_08960 [bacterium]